MPDLKQRKKWFWEEEPVTPPQEPIPSGRPLAIEELLKMASGQPETAATARVTAPMPKPPVLEREVLPGTTTRYQSREFYKAVGLDPDEFLRDVKVKEPSLYKKIEAYPIAAATTPLINVGGVSLSAGDIVGLGLVAYGAYAGVRALPALFKEIGDVRLRAATIKGVDKWIAERARGVQPSRAKALQNILYNIIAKNKTAVQEKATESMLARMGRGVNASKAATEAVDEALQNFENTLLPKITVSNTAVPGQTFSMSEILSGLKTVTAPSVQAVQAGRMELGATKEPSLQALRSGRGAVARKLTEFVTPELLARRAYYEAKLSVYGKQHGDIETAKQDFEAAKTILERDYKGDNPEAVKAIAEAESAIQQAAQKPPTAPVAGVTPPGVALRETPSVIGTRQEILVNDKVVGSVEYGTTEGLGVKGIIISDIEVTPDMRRTGVATQVLNQILDKAKGQTIYSGVLKPDGAKWLEGLEKQGIVKLTPAEQPGLGSIISKPGVTPTVAPEQPPVTPAPAEALTTPQGAAQKVTNTIERAKANPKQVKPPDAEYAHVEQAAPDGPQPPKKPPVTPEGMPSPERPSKPLSEILGNAPQGERPDQTLLRIHEAARNTITRQTSIVIQKGGQKLKKLGIGATKRGQLVPREQDKAKLLELYNALHNPSKVESGEIAIPKGFEGIYNELRGLADWDTASRIDFDPKAAVIDDWFFRGWKPPEGMFPTTQKGRLGIKPKPLRMPRVNATFDEMIDLGFEPLFWNPYQQWGYRHNLGEIYREQMELIKWLKGMGDDFARPEAGGILPEGWRVPRIGPAFEGKPFATTSIDGEPVVMYTRRWIVPQEVAQTLENIYGRRPNLGKVFIGKLAIDPLGVIDALTFIPKRAKLLFSLFQQVDFLTRSGAGGWTGATDMLMAGKPISAVKSVIRYPKTVAEIIYSNFSPGKRLNLLKQLDDITPIIPTRKGINLKGISEQGLSTMDVTIFSEEMDKLMRSLPERTGLWGKVKGIPSSFVDLESAMRRGLFNGVYPAAMITDIKNNIAPIIARQFPNSTDTQINAMIAKITNMKYSTIPPAQSAIQNPAIRETLRRIFFSLGESEALLRQATNIFHGPNKAFWAKNALGVFLFVIAMANIIHYMSTGKPLPKERYLPISKDNWSPLGFGYNSQFAAPTLPFRGRGGTEITLDLMGQMDTALRILDPWSFFTARTNVPVRALINQVSGTDFYGAPIDEVGPGGVVSRTAAMAIDLFAPIGAGGITTEALRRHISGAEKIIPEAESRLGMTGLGIQATGLNLRAEWTGAFLDRKARESGMRKRDGSAVMSWADLEPNQKDKLLSDNALVKELAARRETSLERGMPGAAGFAEVESLDKQRIDRGESLVTEFERGDFDASTFRDEVGNLKTEIAARKSQVDEDFQLYQDTQELPEDPNKRALVEYYNLFDKAKRESGSIDWDKVDQLEADLRRTWTLEQETYVNDNIGLTEWGPKMQEYVDAQDALQASGYWDIEEPNQAQKRIFLRRTNPQIDAILQKWYGYKPASGGQTTTPQPSRTPVTSQPSGSGNWIWNK